MSATLALAASLLWGASDFLGGRLTRRLPSSTVIAASQLLAALALAAVAVAAGTWQATTPDVVLAAAAGLLWVIGLGALYRALAVGVAGVVAPIASTGMAVPVLVGLARGERLGAAQLAGVLAAAVGVVCCAGPQLSAPRGRAGSIRPILLAAAAALAFGGEVTLLSRASHASIPTTLVVMRLVAVAAVGTVSLRRRALALTRADAPPLLLLAALDVAATTTFLLAARGGAMSLVSVLGSLFPAVTVLLARRFQAERIRPVQAAGVLATLLGAACIAGAGVTA